jgi:hypothetical protein
MQYSVFENVGTPKAGIKIILVDETLCEDNNEIILVSDGK